MKSLIVSSICTFLLAAPALSQEIFVTNSEDLQEKFEEDYGLRESDKLSKRLDEKVRNAFDKAGLTVHRIEITLEDAKPNHPTFKQLGDTPGLDGFRSVSLGGAKITGQVFDEEGNSIGQLTYRWFENDIRFAQHGGTWSDANRAINRFAKQTSERSQSAKHTFILNGGLIWVLTLRPTPHSKDECISFASIPINLLGLVDLPH